MIFTGGLFITFSTIIAIIFHSCQFPKFDRRINDLFGDSGGDFWIIFTVIFKAIVDMIHPVMNVKKLQSFL